MSQTSQERREISLTPCPADKFSGRFDERNKLLEVLRRTIDQKQAIDHGQVIMISGTSGSGKSSFLNWAEYIIQNEKEDFVCPTIKKEFWANPGMVFTTFRQLLSDLKEHQKVGWFRKSLDDPIIKKSINAALDILEKASSLAGSYSIAINAAVAPTRRFVSSENFDYSNLLISFFEVLSNLSKELAENNRFLAIILDNAQWSSGPDFDLMQDLIRVLPANIVLIIAFLLDTEAKRNISS
jgi:energy-coupling factor transporter ATP-binding protein EcfA2